MSDLVIPDVSEFQGSIDWKRLVAAGYPVAIVRAHNGNRADHQWAANRAGAHAAGVQGLGIYQYVVAGRDAATQAGELCDLIGALKPGEWPICDLEEGSGDQSGRAHAWYTTVASRLHGASEELYSGDYFYNAHHLSAAGFKRIWLAAYSSHEPSTAHELWQFTDARSFPGIPGSNDASTFHGTLDEFLNAIGVDMALTDQDKNDIAALAAQKTVAALTAPGARDAIGSDALFWLNAAISGVVPAGANPDQAKLVKAAHANLVKLFAPAAPTQ